MLAGDDFSFSWGLASCGLWAATLEMIIKQTFKDFFYM